MRTIISLGHPPKVVWLGFIEGANLLRRVAVFRPGVRLEIEPEYYLPRPCNLAMCVAEAKREARVYGYDAVIVGDSRYDVEGEGVWKIAAWAMAPRQEIGIVVGDERFTFRYRPGEESMIGELVRQLGDVRPELPAEMADDLIDQIRMNQIASHMEVAAVA